MAWLLSLLIQDKSPFSVMWVILDVAMEDGHLWWRLMAARFFYCVLFSIRVRLIDLNKWDKTLWLYYNYYYHLPRHHCYISFKLFIIIYWVIHLRKCETFVTGVKKHDWTSFSSFYREPFIIAAPTGLIETNTTLLEGRLGLTHRKPSWPSTGTHLSLRSVLAWKSMNSSGLLSSTSSWLFVLTDRRWAIPRNLTASWYVENAYWCSCFFAKQM